MPEKKGNTSTRDYSYIKLIEDVDPKVRTEPTRAYVFGDNQRAFYHRRDPYSYIPENPE